MGGNNSGFYTIIFSLRYNSAANLVRLNSLAVLRILVLPGSFFKQEQFDYNCPRVYQSSMKPVGLSQSGFELNFYQIILDGFDAVQEPLNKVIVKTS
ncbi:hypothetical protein P0092_04930 [Ruminiclostridium papyrosolvens DSM 2782]|uniref:hypothetical protein n=1 Tax=Ruminiclostridium papyrosolvens TaxID=29362 RepID=UPI0023E40167|nr:hypothetical protein [Ruminiclostridium papyrosolvens]WES35324.1 hypothetical protein P0092_04930 [Ruminiclostridium papyrosolvens DSM 2782]